MIKVKVSKNDILKGSNNIRYASYCELQHLLKNHEPIAYNSGIYGWNFDVYEVYGVTIVTGYRNLFGLPLNGDSRMYEKQAAEVWSLSWDIPYNRKKEQVELLLQRFCELQK